MTVLVVEPGGLRDAPALTGAQAEARAAVAAEVKARATDGRPPTPAAEAAAAANGNGSADAAAAVPSGVWTPPLRSDDDRVRVLMDFGQHGREFITSEVGVRLLEVLAATGSDAPDEGAADAALASAAGLSVGSPRFRRLRAVLSRLSLVLLPLENEGGRARVERGDRCERKNGRGVDPNRNWPLDWGRKEGDYDPAEEYPGRAPGSEPETRVVRALARTLRPHAWVNVHSGMRALFTAYDHVARVPRGPAARASLAILARLNARACRGQCAVGSGGKSVGYLAHGTATDHMYATQGVPVAYTWEIYGDETADFDDCFRMFNPLGKEQFDGVVRDWVRASLGVLELLPTHPAVAPLFATGADARLFGPVDGKREPEEAAEAAGAELKAAELQAESARAEEEEEGKAKKKGERDEGGGEGRGAGGTEEGAPVARDVEEGTEAAASAAAAAAAAATEASGGGTAAAAAALLPRRMGPQRQQLLVSPAAGGSGGAAGGSLRVSASGAGSRLLAAAPLLVVCALVVGLAAAALLARRRRAAAAAAAAGVGGGGGAYLPTSLVDLDEGGFGFGPVVAPVGGRRAGGGGLSLVGVVGRRP